jgi:rhodanese-related sulfurtransferase
VGSNPTSGSERDGRGSNEEAIMPRPIDRDEVRRLVDRGAQLVDVLPANEYESDHLPGAISMPLRRLEEEARSALDRGRPVVLYCSDSA